MNHDVHTSDERRIGAQSRRMRERMPESDRRIEGRMSDAGGMPAQDAARDDPAPAVSDPQLLFERS